MGFHNIFEDVSFGDYFVTFWKGLVRYVGKCHLRLVAGAPWMV